jgi:hypothetical protein
VTILGLNLQLASSFYSLSTIPFVSVPPLNSRGQQSSYCVTSLSSVSFISLKKRYVSFQFFALRYFMPTPPTAIYACFLTPNKRLTSTSFSSLTNKHKIPLYSLSTTFRPQQHRLCSLLQLGVGVFPTLSDMSATSGENVEPTTMIRNKFPVQLAM